MSVQETKRRNAISDEFDTVIKKSSGAVSEIVKQTAAVKLFVVFLHDNLLNGKGDLSEADRVVLRNALVPLYPQIQNVLSELTDLFNIYNEDIAVWQSNFDAYLLKNPNTLDEALNRFPSVG